MLRQLQHDVPPAHTPFLTLPAALFLVASHNWVNSQNLMGWLPSSKWIHTRVKPFNDSTLLSIQNPSSLALHASHFMIWPQSVILAFHPPVILLSRCAPETFVSWCFLSFPCTFASEPLLHYLFLFFYFFLNLIYFFLSIDRKPSHMSRPRVKGTCPIKHPLFLSLEFICHSSGPLSVPQFSLMIPESLTGTEVQERTQPWAPVAMFLS